jgi:hypothetical protein
MVVLAPLLELPPTCCSNLHAPRAGVAQCTRRFLTFDKKPGKTQQYVHRCLEEVISEETPRNMGGFPANHAALKFYLDAFIR